jgi:hypothetical protein
MTTTHDEPPRDGDASDLDLELRPVAEALRRMPAVRPGSTARVVAAARGEPMPLAIRRRRPSIGLTTAAAAVLVLAAGIGLVRRHETTAAPLPLQVSADVTVSPVVVHGPGGAQPITSLIAGSTAAPLRTTALTESGELEDAAVSVPFVLRLPDARRIALVGDFNGWSPAATQLRRTANGVWAVTVPLTPGRHAYGFIVDDTLWVRDPRAEIEHDADYGRDHSVIVVGRP